MNIKEVKEIVMRNIVRSDTDGIKDMVTELTTLIEKERASAIKGFLIWHYLDGDGDKYYDGGFPHYVAEYLRTLEPKESECPACDGTGKDQENSDGENNWACPKCRGTGKEEI